MARIARPNRPLADVNLLPQKDGSHEVVVCFMPDVESLVGEGDSRAVLALDASRSIKDQFGVGGVFDTKPNYVQGVARKLGEILCGVTRSGKVSMLYWAMGPGGAETEEVGEFDAPSCLKAGIVGPKKKNGWGTGTQMLPAIRYTIEKVGKDADFTFGVIVTDGIIEDEAACLTYCMKLGEEVAKGKRKPVKFVLIGVGAQVNEDQLQKFNDMFEETPLKGKVDLFASGVAADMQSEADIIAVVFGELMNEEVEVAASGRVTADGKELANFADRLPGKFRFVLPKGIKEFTVETPNGSVTQDVSEAI
ncbi:MAG: hypothetical protein L0241_01940 [Planctomycetia bacterium]|nr:hypothetical protein [Planctomycetia bacterium]